MIPYYILLFTPILFSIFLLFNKKSNKGITCTVFFILFLLLLVLRDISVGADLLGYKSVFEHSQDMSFKEIVEGGDIMNFEAGWVFVNKVFSFFTSSFQTFMIICACFSVIPVFLLYRRYTSNTILTIALFISLAFFTSYFSGLRQAFAMSAVPLAFYLVKRRKLLLFILTVTIVTLIHHSAIVLLLLYPLYHITIPRKSIIFILVFFVVIFSLRRVLFPLFQSILWEKYSTYEMSETGAFMVLVLLFLFVIMAFVFLPNDNELDRDTIAFRNILVLTVFIQVFAGINTVAMRVNYYYLLLVPIAVPTIIDKVRTSNKTLLRFLSLILIVICYAKFFVGAYTGDDWAQIFPYRPYWIGQF